MNADTASRKGRQPETETVPAHQRIPPGFGERLDGCWRRREESASPAPRSITSTPAAINSRLRAGMLASAYGGSDRKRSAYFGIVREPWGRGNVEQ